MISDLLTIMWKDLKEMFFQRNTRRSAWISIMVLLGLFGIIMPLQNGREWLESPMALIYWGWLPFILVNNMIADAFAGERERYTLETLLASRLSDLSILLGKIAVAITYGWGMAIAGILLGLVTVNMAFGKGQLLLYPAEISIGILIISLLISGLAAGLGVLISLRASTVRQAQQIVSLAFLVIFLPLFLLPMLPKEWSVKALQMLSQIDIRVVAYIGLAVIFLLDAILIGAAILRFKRSRLILD